MEEELPFRAELWDEGFKKIMQVIATTGDFLTAKAAYEAAVKTPRRVDQRHGHQKWAW
jgi:hypothetical protein